MTSRLSILRSVENSRWVPSRLLLSLGKLAGLDGSGASWRDLVRPPRLVHHLLPRLTEDDHPSRSSASCDTFPSMMESSSWLSLSISGTSVPTLLLGGVLVLMLSGEFDGEATALLALFRFPAISVLSLGIGTERVTAIESTELHASIVTFHSIKPASPGIISPLSSALSVVMMLDLGVIPDSLLGSLSLLVFPET